MDPATVMKVSAFVCAGARPSTTITPQGTGSKDSAAMEETCDWRTHSQLGHAATESGMRQSKGIVLNCCVCIIVPQQCKKIATPPPFLS